MLCVIAVEERSNRMTQQSSSRGKQSSATTRGSQEGQNTASGAAREVTGQVKETAGQVTEQAQQVAGQAVDQARQQVSSRIAGQKDRAAESLTSVAQALRQAGQQLREQDQQGVTGYIDSAASQVERVSNYLKHNDFGQLIDDVERFARRQPALFLGGTFVLGLLGARFLKSSRPYTGPAGGYTGGAPLAQRQQGYYTGYPGTAGFQEASGAARYGSGMPSGPYSTTGRTMTEQPSPSGTGPRSYDQRPEE
jgi:uncharacterized protein YjbJ (UPF0337 family)